MYRTTGLYLPTHRPLPVSEVEHARAEADNNPSESGLTEPMVFARLFLERDGITTGHSLSLRSSLSTRAV